MAAYSNVAVIGAGVMGHAIALVHAIGGCNVILQDRSPDALSWAEARLRDLIPELARFGLISPDQADVVAARIAYENDLAAAIADADLVVEAIIEDVAAKRALYAELASLMNSRTTLASNTSFLDVFPLLPEALKPRSLIVHWYTPPYLIDLVDVVPAPDSPAEITEQMVTFLRDLGKKPVKLKKFVPGYIANNVQMAIESEIFRLLDTGVADVAEIDDAVRFGLAQRLCLMGQFKKIDYTGLKVVRDIHAAGIYDPPKKPTGTNTLDQLLAQGASGLLAGKGFYDYGDEPAASYLTRRDIRLLRLKSALAGDDDTL